MPKKGNWGTMESSKNEKEDNAMRKLENKIKEIPNHILSKSQIKTKLELVEKILNRTSDWNPCAGRLLQYKIPELKSKIKHMSQEINLQEFLKLYSPEDESSYILQTIYALEEKEINKILSKRYQRYGYIHMPEWHGSNLESQGFSGKRISEALLSYEKMSKNEKPQKSHDRGGNYYAMI